VSRKVKGEIVEQESMGREEYVRKLLDAYRTTPGTTGSIRRPDRILAAQLHQRGVPLRAVENALVLAVSRRLQHSPEAPPLGTIRSLAYFVPVIEEVLEMKVAQDYCNYLRYRLAPYFPNMGKTPAGR
jgi:hypothetical protein